MQTLCIDFELVWVYYAEFLLLLFEMNKPDGAFLVL